MTTPAKKRKPWREEVQKTNILSVLGDHEDMMKGRQKELNSLKEMGAMTAVTRSVAVGKRVIKHDGSIERKTVA